MGIESWLKKSPKAEKNPGALTGPEKGILAAGAAAAALNGVGMHEEQKDKPLNVAVPAVDTMPAGYENPTLGKTSDSAPDPITIQNPEK